MRYPIPSLVVALCLALPVASLLAQDKKSPTSAEAAMKKTVETFFQGLKERDGAKARSVLAHEFTGIEESSEDASFHAQSPADALPDRINDDWEEATLSSIRTQMSSTSDVTGIVYFTLSLPLGDATIKGYKKAIEDKRLREKLSDKKIAQFQNALAKKALDFELFAVLAKRKGEWKIVCMTMPH